MSKMNLYLISQDINKDSDAYTGAVVAAENEEKARMIHPRGCPELFPWDGTENYSWVDASDVIVKLIGVAIEGTKSGVICASFNAS